MYGYEEIKIDELDQRNYPQFRSRLIALYSHAFTTGAYAQHIDPETVEATLDEIVRKGSAFLAFDGGRPVGLAAVIPLIGDRDFPVDKCTAIPPAQALYIAEVLVHADYRGKGIASQMVEEVLQNASDDYSFAVIRVWAKNEPALKLYKKLGFTPLVEIFQKKLNADGAEFAMKKVYLSKSL